MGESTALLTPLAKGGAIGGISMSGTGMWDGDAEDPVLRCAPHLVFLAHLRHFGMRVPSVDELHVARCGIAGKICTNDTVTTARDAGVFVLGPSFRRPKELRRSIFRHPQFGFLLPDEPSSHLTTKKDPQCGIVSKTRVLNTGRTRPGQELR